MMLNKIWYLDKTIIWHLIGIHPFSCILRT
jgi:hypothetical protein